MSASPFRTTSGSFVESPVPIVSDSLSEVKKSLEDVPFDSDSAPSEFAEVAVEMSSPSTREKRGRSKRLFERVLMGRGRRKLREQMLSSELQDLRASYAGLLQSTETIKDHLVKGSQDVQVRTEPISPFPNAVKGIETIQTRQEEASEILSHIRHRLEKSKVRDEQLVNTLDKVHGGVDAIQGDLSSVRKDVKGVNTGVAKIVASQTAAVASLGDFRQKMEKKFQEVADTARANVDRLEGSSDDVLKALQRMEKNSQRLLWVFSSLTAVLFFVLVVISANMGKFQTSQTDESNPSSELMEARGEGIASANEGLVVEEFEF